MKIVLVLITILILLVVAQWTISRVRRRLSGPVALFEFRVSTLNPSKGGIAWCVAGAKESIQKFIPEGELYSWIRVTWTADGKEYIGTYKKRFVSRFKRQLRTRGARLVIYKEQPEWSRRGSRQFHFGGKDGGRLTGSRW